MLAARFNCFRHGECLIHICLGTDISLGAVVQWLGKPEGLLIFVMISSERLTLMPGLMNVPGDERSVKFMQASMTCAILMHPL